MKAGHWIAFGTVAAFTAVVAGQPEEREHARARLISESKALIPGTTAWLALVFEIDEQWHIYWNGVNDSGFAPKMKTAFPAGYTAGEILWPAPKRHVQPGDILDHVYERQATLMFPVTIPKDAKPGSEVEFKASSEWLVCHDVCLPGDAEVSVKVKVGNAGEKAEPGPQASLFAKARERHAKKIPKENSPVKVSAAEGKASIQVAGASEVTFYPLLEGVGLPKLLKEGQTKGDTLKLTFAKESGKPAMLKGIVEAKPQGGGTPSIWLVDVDLENKASPGPSNPDPRARGD
jgi:DsbC/DsbD-like thiol-disulfide interchange protein